MTACLRVCGMKIAKTLQTVAAQVYGIVLRQVSARDRPDLLMKSYSGAVSSGVPCQPCSRETFKVEHYHLHKAGQC